MPSLTRAVSLWNGLLDIYALSPLDTIEPGNHRLAFPLSLRRPLLVHRTEEAATCPSQDATILVLLDTGSSCSILFVSCRYREEALPAFYSSKTLRFRDFDWHQPRHLQNLWSLNGLPLHGVQRLNEATRLFSLSAGLDLTKETRIRR